MKFTCRVRLCFEIVLVNFMATLEGLDDQMLGIVVGQDEPEKEAKREELVIEQAKMQKQLRDIEDKILQLSKGTIYFPRRVILLNGSSDLRTQSFG